MPGAFVSVLTGQKNLASKLAYMSASNTTMKATNRTIQNVFSGEQSTSLNFNQILKVEKKKEAVEKEKIKKSFIGLEDKESEIKEKNVEDVGRKRSCSHSEEKEESYKKMRKRKKGRRTRSNSSENIVPKKNKKN